MFGKILDYLSVWQDFTFPDDLMEGKTLTQRSRLSTKCETEFKRRVERRYQDLWGIIRREWETRKSGTITGEECPHLHVLWDKKNISEKNFKKFCLKLAKIWIDVIKTGETEKALKVATMWKDTIGNHIIPFNNEKRMAIIEKIGDKYEKHINEWKIDEKKKGKLKQVIVEKKEQA